MSTSIHSAAGQAAGYEFQRQLALVLFCEAYGRDPSAVVRLEAVEDIDVVSNDVSIDSRIQVKHHLRDYTLTDRSPELWRTLTVWMDLIEALDAERLPLLQLMTTSRSGSDSAASVLGPDDRDTALARDRLLVAASETGAKETRPARTRFAKLDAVAQQQLLSAITVLDTTERVTDLDGRLLKALGLVVPTGQPGAFVERLKGWWVGRSTQLLAGERSHVSGAELYHYCDAIRDEFRRGALVVSEELSLDPTEDEKAPLLSRPFIRQLRMVMARSEALDLAVRHYYRAFAQRGRWSRDLEDLEDDIARYERRLRDEWEIAFVALRARASDDPQQRSEIGLDLAMSFGSRTAAQLRGIDDPVLCRGTLHGLADEIKIGWHPDFRERIEELLGDA